MKGERPITFEATSDAEILAGVARGEESALSVLYDRHAARLYGLALKILGDAGLAQDVVQELFVFLWENASRFENHRGSALAWTMVMCRNRCIDRLRVRNREKSRSSHIDEAVLQIPTAERADDPLDVASRGEAQRRVAAALEKLPEEQRQPIEMAYFGGLSQSEIAGELQMPLGTVKTRLRLGMQKLRNIMIER